MFKKGLNWEVRRIKTEYYRKHFGNKHNQHAQTIPEYILWNRFLMMSMDYFSKRSKVISILNEEATMWQKTNLKMPLQGIPKELHSCQGLNFETEVWKNLISLLGTKTRSSPPSVWCNSSKNLLVNKQLFTPLYFGNQWDWDKLVSLFLLLYRALVLNAKPLSIY